MSTFKGGKHIKIKNQKNKSVKLLIFNKETSRRVLANIITGHCESKMKDHKPACPSVRPKCGTQSAEFPPEGAVSMWGTVLCNSTKYQPRFTLRQAITFSPLLLSLTVVGSLPTVLSGL